METASKMTNERDSFPAAPSTSPTPPPIGGERSAIIILSAVLFRSLVAFHPPSGYGDDHSSHFSHSSDHDPASLPAYGGDYEAQRHWMEIAYSLPAVGSWYTHDPDYWGLDYPPLTAYVSWLCGWLSARLVGPASVALDASRGYEGDRVHFAFMRGTVLVLDAAVYFSAVYVLSGRLASSPTRRAALLAFALFQPAAILIDHGHFQYNAVATGLALWSFHFMTLPSFASCAVGAVLFCLSLNFKQTALYYAPAAFAYLLGRCTNHGVPAFLARVALLGAAVLSTFLALWWPVAALPDPDLGPRGSVLHALRRLFPFRRGLFEGKVANLWCALSVRPLSLRRRVPSDLQPAAAAVLTLLLALPACVALFRKGQRKEQRLQDLLWGAAATGLAFFLASFQVHEKGILLPAAPLSLLYLEEHSFTIWFGVAAAWSLWPLMVVDRLAMAYFSTMGIFAVVAGGFLEELLPHAAPAAPRTGWRKWGHWTGAGSYALMGALHLAQPLLPPPARLPDLYPVLWSVAGCACFGCAWAATTAACMGFNENERARGKKRQ